MFQTATYHAHLLLHHPNPYPRIQLTTVSLIDLYRHCSLITLQGILLIAAHRVHHSRKLRCTYSYCTCVNWRAVSYFLSSRLSYRGTLRFSICALNCASFCYILQTFSFVIFVFLLNHFHLLFYFLSSYYYSTPLLFSLQLPPFPQLTKLQTMSREEVDGFVQSQILSEGMHIYRSSDFEGFGRALGYGEGKEGKMV
jgi:hypothetical protein